MPAALNAHECARLASASRSAVVDGLAKLRTRGKWLTQGTTFPSKLLKKKFATFTAADKSQIAELIAVSVPSHCFDGWGFLGRALASLVAGDAHAARHFAYYAELRAALSILAGQGIGVFNLFNCALQSNGTLIEVDHRHQTHTMTWLALDYWAREPGSGGVVCDSFRLGRGTFADCIRSMWPGGTSAAARDLILSWGVDLRMYSADRLSRNESSYSPQALHPLPNDVKQALEFVDMLWRCFEPTASKRFPQLDRHLFRLVCEREAMASGTTRSQVAADLRVRHAKLDALVQSEVSEDFLSRASEHDDLALIKYGQRGSDPSSPLEMISRASLLLRSATALCIDSLDEAGLKLPADMNFWMDSFGQNLGFWDSNGPPASLSDLWDDVRTSLEDAASIASGGGPDFCRFKWFSPNENGLPRICEAERIVLWGLGS